LSFAEPSNCGKPFEGSKVHSDKQVTSHSMFNILFIFQRRCQQLGSGLNSTEWQNDKCKKPYVQGGRPYLIGSAIWDFMFIGPCIIVIVEE
jgi:hypothetical protein